MDDVESPLGGLPRGQSVDDDTSHIERGSPDGGVLTRAICECFVGTCAKYSWD